MNRNPRIAILTNYPSDYKSFTGGVETATAGLLEGLSEYQDHYEFQIISFTRDKKAMEAERKDGFTFFKIITPHNWQRPRLLYKVVKAIHLIDQIQPDLVHSQDSIAWGIAGTLSRKKSLLTIHGVKSQEANKRLGWEKWAASADALFEKRVWHSYKNILCVSSYIQNLIRNDCYTYLIPNAVRSTFFSVQRRNSSDKPLLLFVGGLSPLKGPEDLINAHNILRKQFPNLQTIFCGLFETDQYKKRLRSLSVDGIQFVGLVDEDGLKKWLSIASVLVLPSLQENAPIVISEAMAAGVPVVATKVGGIPEMVEDNKTGYLYPPGDIQQLVMCLGKLLNSHSLAEAFGMRGKDLALTRYHPITVARQTIEVYRTILADSHD